jgi:hypothetical protein
LASAKSCSGSRGVAQRGVRPGHELRQRANQRLRTRYKKKERTERFSDAAVAGYLGLGSMNPVVFAVIAAFATVPIAALSWFLAKKPSLSLKSRLKRRSVAPVEVRQPA